MPVSPRLEKVNIVNNDHGRTQKSDFLVSVGKTNFTDHHTPDTVLRVLGIQFWSVKCTTATVRYAKISSISIPCHPLSNGQWLDYMKTNHSKML